ncbi:Rne/Rng family ribonuclease [Thalassospira sp. MBR-102]|uniref:ribonuclease E/G n=1 Tax=Thalassospira sp. MBR-102 TaxID=3156466 RepID=UPI0033959B5D
MVAGGTETDRLLIDAVACERRIALIRNDRLARLWIDRGGPARFDIHLGRVSKILPEMAAAMVVLDGVDDGLLPFDRIDGPLHEGQWVIVQISRLGFEDKGPKLTGRIAIEGLGMILRPNEHPTDAKRGGLLELPRKLKDENRRAVLMTLFKGLIAREEGITLRSLAIDWDDGALAGELGQLRAVWKRAQAALASPAKPVVVFKALSDADQLIERHVMAGGECIVDGSDEFVRLRGLLRVRGLDDAHLIRHDGARLLFDDQDIEDDIATALQPRVPLPGGGWIAVEQTTALCAIDVNAGGSDSDNDQARRAERVNLRAAPEIVRQLQLRNIGGLVVIDPLRMAGKASRDRFETALRDAFGPEMSGAVQFGGFTRLGLFELTRQRGGIALVDLMQGRLPDPMPTRTAALNFVLRSVIRDMRSGQGGQGGRYRLYLSKGLVADLAPGSHGQQILERAMGMAPELAADESLSRADYRLEKL